MPDGYPICGVAQNRALGKCWAPCSQRSTTPPLLTPIAFRSGLRCRLAFSTRKSGECFKTYNDPKHRAFAEHICQQSRLLEANDELNSLSGKKGVMIYYPITENKEASLR